MGERVKFIADETEAELDEDYRTTIGDNYKKMLNNDPSILSEVLITTSQNPDGWHFGSISDCGTQYGSTTQLVRKVQSDDIVIMTATCA